MSERGGLPWYCIWTEFSVHRKTLELCALVRDDNAGMYVVRLFEHCADQALDGLLKASVVEGVCRWRKRRGVLLDALTAVGFLESRPEGFVLFHAWEERNGARIRQWLRDNAKRKPRGPSAEDPRVAPHQPSEDHQGDHPETPRGSQGQDVRREKKRNEKARSLERPAGHESPGAGGGHRTGPEEDAAQANAAAPEGSAPAARDGGDAGAGGIPAKLGAPGPAPSPAADPEPGQGESPKCPVTPASSRGARSVAVDEDRPPPRPLRIANLVDMPLVSELRARIATAMRHGVVVAKAGEETAVGRELENICALQGVDDVERFALTTARRQGVDIGSLAWVLTIARDMPAREDPRPPSQNARWDDLVARMTPEQREAFEAEKDQAYADIVAMRVWSSEANRLLDAAEERLWAKWSSLVGRPVAAAGGA